MFETNKAFIETVFDLHITWYCSEIFKVESTQQEDLQGTKMDKKKEKILIVDDTPANLHLLTDLLGDQYDITVALDGLSALDSLGLEFFDLILLDVMMPDMDGFEVLERIRQDASLDSPPVIFITALDSSGSKTRGFELGAVDYITKPFDVAEVKARIRTHLKLKHTEEKLRWQNEHLENLVASGPKRFC